jgi:hypothetical protein
VLSFGKNVLQQFAESKLSAVDFCSQRGLAVQSFYQWKRKLLPIDKPPPVSAVVSVRIIPAFPKPSPHAIQIITPSGFTIRWSMILFRVRSFSSSIGGEIA